MSVKLMIRLTDDAAVETALATANGKAKTHTYKSALDIRAIAHNAETRLEQLGVPKKTRIGAIVEAISGDKLPSAYKYPPIRSRVTLIRRATGWYLTCANATKYNGMPSPKLIMTEEQEAAAIWNLKITAARL